MSSSNTSPTCSVVVPVYRGARKMRPLLESLSRQTLVKNDFEVIIVDDGSPTGDFHRLEALVEEFMPLLHLKLIRQKYNGGPAVARNRGLKEVASSSSFIFFTDDDCDLPARWMETHLKLYAERPHISAIGGWYDYPLDTTRKDLFAQFLNFHYQAAWRPLSIRTLTGDSDELYPLLPISNTANLSIRSSVLACVPGFDEDFLAPGSEDYYFAHCIRQAGFLLLYIPLHARHRKVLSLRSYFRLLLNRGLGLYVLKTKIEMMNSQRDIYKYFFRNFSFTVASHARDYRSVRRHKTRLITLGWLYYFFAHSPFAYWWHGQRWRYLSRKRNERRASVI